MAQSLNISPDSTNVFALSYAICSQMFDTDLLCMILLGIKPNLCRSVSGILERTFMNGPLFTMYFRLVMKLCMAQLQLQRAEM